jgi:hypothetical protein
MQEGCPPQRPAIGQGRRTLGRIEDKLNTAVFDGIDDVRPPLGHLIDFDGRNTLCREVSLGS